MRVTERASAMLNREREWLEGLAWAAWGGEGRGVCVWEGVCVCVCTSACVSMCA